MRHSRFGVANWFIRLAVDGETIQVFGDGRLIARLRLYRRLCGRDPARRQCAGSGRPGAQRRQRPALLLPRARRDGDAGRRPRRAGSSPRSPPSAPRRSRATSTPTSAVSAALDRLVSRARRSTRACAPRWTTTSATAPSTGETTPPERRASSMPRPVPFGDLARECAAIAADLDAAFARVAAPRLVRARPRGRRLRDASSPPGSAPARASAAPRGPTRSRWRSRRSTSARATR